MGATIWSSSSGLSEGAVVGLVVPPPALLLLPGPVIVLAWPNADESKDSASIATHSAVAMQPNGCEVRWFRSISATGYPFPA